MRVKLISYSTPSSELSQEGLDDIQDVIAFCARVSNPANQMNTETSERLLKYLMKNKHWSPFEMTSVCLEIETTRDIARQILRHRSFSFQEFCLSGDTEVYTTHPTPAKVKLSLLYKCWKSEYGLPNHQLKVYDEDENNFVSADIKEVFYTGKKPLYKVTLSDGRTIKTTKEHKFLTYSGFDTLENIIGLENLNKGDINSIKVGTGELIACCNKPKFVEINHVEFLGEEDTYDIEVEHPSHNYIANGFVVHNSQRYANPVEELSFELREARLQDLKNRQNSIATEDETLQQEWNKKQQEVVDKAKEAYSWAIENGIAKEQARAVLPEGNTLSRIYVNGTIRSWIHYCELRGSNGTQKEHMDIAHACAEVIGKLFPLIKL
jgi:thymidylate synthase ThyX